MSAKRMLVGIAVDAAMGYGRQVLRGVLTYANINRKWRLIEEFRLQQLDPAAWPKCDGIITTTSSSEILQALRKKCGFVISCSGSTNPDDVPVVRINSHEIGRLAAEHLLDCRLEHFAFYGGVVTPTSAQRLAGFCEELAKHGYTCDEIPVPYNFSGRVGWGRESHWPKLIEWMKAAPKPIGVMGFDDMAAFDMVTACMDGGIRVPDQVAVVGVNNDDLLCESAWPALTSIQTDYQRVGYEAAAKLDHLLNGTSPGKISQLMELPPTGIVCRASTDMLAVDEPDLVAALRYIRKHACDPCSVENILEEVPVGRRWLERRFLQKFGRSPHSEINYVQVNNAQQMLAHTDLSIPEIAQKCGFSAVQSFSRVFKRISGVTPAVFRRERVVPDGR